VCHGLTLIDTAYGSFIGKEWSLNHWIAFVRVFYDTHTHTQGGGGSGYYRNHLPITRAYLSVKCSS